MLRWVLVGATTSALGLGCAVDVRPPFAPGGRAVAGSAAVGVGIRIRRPSPAPTAHPSPTPAPTSLPPGETEGCVEVEGGANHVTAIVGGTELPFPVSAAFVRWDVRDCTDAALLVGLTDGECSLGHGRQLVFELDRDLGEVSLYGDVIVSDDPDLRIVEAELRVPRGPEPAVRWGTCLGAFGVLRVSEIGFMPGDPVRAGFDLELTDCAGDAPAEVVRVAGAFDMTVPASFADACGAPSSP